MNANRDYKIYTVYNFPFELLDEIPIAKRRKGQRKGMNGCDYKDVICAFDIETSRLDDVTFMYIWQFAIGTDTVIIGRTWDEFRELLLHLISSCHGKEKYVVFCHNLSYEFQFLRSIYTFQPEDVFCVKSRKILRATAFQCIELRCSYLLSNMSLKEFTEKMQVKHTKRSGEEFDYSAIRYPWTELTEEQLDYCVYDVIGLIEAVQKSMSVDDDNIYSLPLTSTGYVRRDAKTAMQKTPPNYVSSLLPPTEIYELLREAFRGGNTHANRYFVKEIDGETQLIIENVHSFDRSSSYPDVNCNCKFPISPFVRLNGLKHKDVIYQVHILGKALLMRVRMKNVRLKNKYEPVPYLPVDKCRKAVIELTDNGRVLEASTLETSLTDLDWKIITSMYDCEIEYLDVYSSNYGYLPKQLVNVIVYYYKKKTELKGVEGQEVFYMKLKNKLNSIFGMMAQDPGKALIEFHEFLDKVSIEEKKKNYVKRGESISEILKKAYKRAFLPYQWGVWTTAWARFRLQEGIDIVGDDCVYVDTDSVKFIGEHSFEDFNKKRIADSIQSGAYATDPKGETHYMGVFEEEETCKQFSTMGAKKYVYIDQKDRLHVTISGVNKKWGGKELEKNGGITAFQEGFTFEEAGGVELYYNDNATSRTLVIDDEHPPIEITSYVTIKDSTYTLGTSADYDRLLKAISANYDDVDLTL